MTEMMDEVCGNVFLLNQKQLLDEPVAQNVEEAIEFLEDCMALVFENEKELLAYLKEEGVDYAGEDLSEVLEVFKLPDGRYLYVEA